MFCLRETQHSPHKLGSPEVALKKNERVNDSNNNDEHRCNARAREKSLLERHEKQS